MADKLIGSHTHLSYRALLEIFSGYLMRMTCLSWSLRNPPRRAHYVGVSPHVPMLYVSTGAIKALYSPRRIPSEMWRFLTQRDHSLWKATAESCFLRVTSSTSPSIERVFHHCSTSRVFLLWMLVCSVLDSLMIRCHCRRQPGAIRWTSFWNTLLLLIMSTTSAYM